MIQAGKESLRKFEPREINDLQLTTPWENPFPNPPQFLTGHFQAKKANDEFK